MLQFCHLHNHSQYSLLDGAADIKLMMKKAVADGQKAIALTDHGNMFGVYKFVNEAHNQGIKPIIGCEFYVVDDRFKQSFEKSKGERDVRYHQLLLAKNKTGYENLSKLCSLGFTEGLYSKYPRVDRELIQRYSEGVIATSCCIGAEIPQAIAYKDMEKAERILKWYIDVFGDDYYIELQRHRGIEDIDIRDKNGKRVMSGVSQEDVNQELLKLAKKYNVKTIVTNDTHYVDEEDWSAHDILLCVNTGSSIADENRFKFPSTDFYFKTQQEMIDLFHDVPEAVDYTMEIESKIEDIQLARDVILPAFPLPQEFGDQDAYLRHLTYLGAKRRYGDITVEIQQRLDFELEVIRNSGYPGYFLIVQDFTSVARELGVSVGPGRGSAAGSAVAYCLGITSIDPIKYDLLFERFLNPERVSMPDIDIDFDDEGRSKVIDYVIDKYGKNQVAQIITYGTMAAKMSIKDVARVMDLPHQESNLLTKEFPENASASLKKILAGDAIDPGLKDKMDGDDIEKANNLRKKMQSDTIEGKILQAATKLEGSVRNTGIHACGVIITPDEITKYVPVTMSKDNGMLVSQFDNSVVEDAGLLKMDFLGLRTLSIIKDAVKLIKLGKDIDVDIENVDLEDAETYELFGRGDTVGIFQYESPGMQKHLADLKPTKFEDLIAMNALYRPGPLQYIPDFIARKHGKQEISYDLDAMEEYLEDTYGITVYQEQVMLLSQKLADFTKGEADMLRKAMGKKKKKLIDEMWPKFLEGCQKNGHDEKIVKKVWSDWEAFASYAFNKSHSTCYAFLAFQTAYLKTHYPSEFMASVLNHNKSSIEKVNFFLRECKRMEIKVLGPDLNESRHIFIVNDQDDIRFGLTALKGVGEGPVDAIIEGRESGGVYTSVLDFVKRVNLRTINKKSLESLVLGGALDNIDEYTRATYFSPYNESMNVLEYLLKFGIRFQESANNAQQTLFGDVTQLIEDPVINNMEEWDAVYRLDKEKEVTGIYISGHPLDDYNLELSYHTNCRIAHVEPSEDKVMKFGCIVTEARYGTSQRGTPYMMFTVQDYSDSLEIRLFNEQCENYKNILEVGRVIYIEGINKKRYNADVKYFKVNDIKLLDTIGKLFTKSITIKLPLSLVNEKLIDDIDDLIQMHLGEHKLYFKVVDDEQPGSELDLISKTFFVDANYKLLQGLEKMGLPYKINK